MTDGAKGLLREAGIPTIAWSDRYGQFYTRIGYRRSKAGKRHQTFHYLVKSEPAAIRRAAARKGEWIAIKQKQGAGAVWADAMLAPTPAMAKLPLSVIEAEIEAYHEQQRVDALEDGVEEGVPRLTIARVRDMFLEYRQTKLGIVGGKGVNGRSFRVEQRTLLAATAGIADEIIDTFDYDRIERFRDSIWRRVGAAKRPLSMRTANNYYGMVARLLNWADRRRVVPYTHDDGVMAPNGLLLDRFKNANGVKIAKYDPEQLKKLLAPADDWQRLIVYLALNCGYYQVDIGLLRADEIHEPPGQPMEFSGSGARPNIKTTSKPFMSSGRKPPPSSQNSAPRKTATA